jgi:prepilin-type N-terminal cleavage/methylation domain-containing protein
MNQKNLGFTVVELLVAISIITLIATIAGISVNNSRTKGRDAQRLVDLKQISLAIDLYFEKVGTYPICPASDNNVPQDQYIDNGETECLSQKLIEQNLMARLPVDARSGGDGVYEWGKDYQYVSSEDGTQYRLRGRLEGKPLAQTHSYPQGQQCPADNVFFPNCSWYGNCIYRGYGASCALTQQYGSDAR